MKRRLALLAGAAMLTVLSSLIPASPASASADPAVCAGTGTATLGLGLAYPVVDPTPNLTTFFFTFTVGTCVPVEKSFTASGTVHGWCGHSTGQGTTSNGASFHFVSAGGTLVVYGHLVGLVNAVPAPGTGSCLDKTATVFLINGAVVLQPVLVGLLPCVSPSCS